jgi:L-lactate dehydrogenase complex protein LldF
MDRDRAGFPTKRSVAATRLPEFEALRDIARDIKNHTLDHLDLYLERYEAKVLAPPAACALGRDGRGGARRSCSTSAARPMPARDQGQVDDLGGDRAQRLPRGANGIQPVETDLGEYIIQLRNERPSHIIAPAVHPTRDQVEADFRGPHPSAAQTAT